MPPAPLSSSRAGLPTVTKKRVVVLCETQRCRYYFLRCFSRELGPSFGMMPTTVGGVHVGGCGVHQFYNTNNHSSSSSSASLLAAMAASSAASEESSGSSGSIEVVSLLSVDSTCSFDVFFVDFCSGTTFGAACLEPVLCDIDTRACVICCEGPDPSFGAASEKAVSNEIVKAADTVLTLWHSGSRNVSGNLRLLVAVCGSAAAGGATIPISMTSGVPSSSSSSLSSSATATTTTSPVIGMGSLPSSSPFAAVVLINMWFDYLFRWTKLVLSIFLFGISQRVVSWTDRVTSVREAMTYIGNQCREVAGEHQQKHMHHQQQQQSHARTAVHFSGMCSLTLVVVASPSSGGTRSETGNAFSLVGDADFGRFVASIR